MGIETNHDPKCWASVLGDCQGGISGEHYISACLFDDDAVFVQGFSWCLPEPKKIGVSSLVKNMLCRKHNSELSDLDAAALGTFNAFRRFVELDQIRRGTKSKSWTVETIETDGRALERWFLKTLINLNFEGKSKIGLNSDQRGRPSWDLVEIAFGRQAFAHPHGLYVAGHTGQRVDLRDHVKITGKTSGNHLVGAAFVFRGVHFYLNLAPIVLGFNGLSRLLYHETSFKYQVADSKGRQKLSHEVRLRF